MRLSAAQFAHVHHSPSEIGCRLSPARPPVPSYSSEGMPGSALTRLLRCSPSLSQKQEPRVFVDVRKAMG